MKPDEKKADEKKPDPRYAAIRLALLNMPFGAMGYKDIEISKIETLEDVAAAIESLSNVMRGYSDRVMLLEDDHRRVCAIFRDLKKLLGAEGDRLIARATEKKP